MRNPKNILQHELIGLECKVIDAKNKSLIGLKGRIVDETKNMIIIEVNNDVKKIPKACSIFEVKLDKYRIQIPGKELLGRPEDRIKKKIRKW